MNIKLLLITLIVLASTKGYTSPWKGNWTSTFGKMSFIEKQTGFNDTVLIYGNYASKGYLFGVSISNQLHGVFYDGKLNSSGSFVFTLNKTQNAYVGKWSFDNINKKLKWNGAKSTDQKTVKLTGIDRYRKIEGMWSTNFGNLELSQEGVFIEGSYDDKGKLYAIFNQENNVMFGLFTNKDRYGLLKFQLNSDENQFKGLWSWETNQWAKQKWDGTKTIK